MDRLKRKPTLSAAGRIELLLLFAIAVLVFALLERILVPDENLNVKIERWYHQAVMP